MTKNTHQEDRINAALAQYLREKLASVKLIDGTVLTNDKQPESKSEEC